MSGGRLLPLEDSRLWAGADVSTCPCPGGMDGLDMEGFLWGKGACWSRVEGVGGLRLTSPSPECMMVLYGLVQVQALARVYLVPQWLDIPGTHLVHTGSILKHTS